MGPDDSNRRQSAALPPISPVDADSSMSEQHRHSLGGPVRSNSISSYNSLTKPDCRSQTTLDNPSTVESYRSSTTGTATSAQTMAAGTALASLSGLLSPSKSEHMANGNHERGSQPKQQLPSIHEALRADLPRPYPDMAHPAQGNSSTSHSLPEYQQRQGQQSSRVPFGDASTGRPAHSPDVNGTIQHFAHPSHLPPPPPPISRPNPSSSVHASPTLQCANLSTVHHLSANQSTPSTIHSAQRPPPPPPPPTYSCFDRNSSFENANHTLPAAGPPTYSKYIPQGPQRQYPYPPPPHLAQQSLPSPSAAPHGTFAPPPPPPPVAPPAPYHACPSQNGYAGNGYGHPHWRGEHAETNGAEESKRSGRVSSAAYGESVKRHLDLFDLEASLNEIAEGGGRMLDFTKVYGRLAHQSPRSGLPPALMPSIAEIDELISREGKMQESLIRIREMIIAQQAVLAEQAHDHRIKGSGSSLADEGQQTQDEIKPVTSNVNGSGSKPRKGRAAPPGRCHSCSRAETPEWRRGPDGARTLCNACGLHYAKLTRKMGQGNEAASNISSLRPKPLGRGSPSR